MTGGRAGRFRAFEAALAARHPADLAHMHLAILAVRPDRQGQGLGTALLGAYHPVLDQDGLPAYLEASDLRTRRLYLRYGYSRLRAAVDATRRTDDAPHAPPALARRQPRQQARATRLTRTPGWPHDTTGCGHMPGKEGATGVDRQQAEPVNPRHVLGRELRQARQQAGLTQAALARDIGSTQGTVSYAERGHPGSSRTFWAAADTRLGTSGTLTALYDQITQPSAAVISQDQDMMTALRGDQIQFLTVAELAGLTRLSKMTIYRLIHTGELQARRYGRTSGYR